MATYNKSFPTPGTVATMQLRLILTETEVDIANNRTKISYTAAIAKTSSNGSPSHDSSNDVVLKLNGSTIYTNLNHGYSFGSGTSTLTITSGTQWVTHGEDGTKSLAYNLDYKESGTQIIGSANLAGSMTLTVIRRGPRVKDSGTWKPSVAYVKDSGEWKVAIPYVKKDGEWKIAGG